MYSDLLFDSGGSSLNDLLVGCFRVCLFFKIAGITHRDVKASSKWLQSSFPPLRRNSLNEEYSFQDALHMGKCKPQAWAYMGGLECTGLKWLSSNPGLSGRIWDHIQCPFLELRYSQMQAYFAVNFTRHKHSNAFSNHLSLGRAVKSM